MNKENNEDIVDRQTFYNAIVDEKKEINISCPESDIAATCEVYYKFGLVYGETKGLSPFSNKRLTVKIKDKNKWLWAKIKYGL